MSKQGRLVVGAVLIAVIIISGLLTGSFSSAQGIGILTAAWLTICIFSFLYKDNPMYRLAEHVMVGLAMGYMTIYYALQILELRWYNRLFLGELNPGEALFGSAAAFRYAMVIPAFFGILMWCRVVPKIAWLSRWSMAVVIGLGSGIAIPWTIQGNITTQLLVATKLPMNYVIALREGPLPELNIADLPYWQVGVPILIIGTVCGLIYFFFSVPHRGLIGKSASLGIWILMIGFGASFGLTVMARLSLFIGRILFLFKNWMQLPWLT